MKNCAVCKVMILSRSNKYCSVDCQLIAAEKKSLRRIKTPDFREYIFERDNFQCTWCGNSERVLHIHHAVMLSRGGQDHVDNCMLLCVKCHKKAHNL